MKIIKYRAWDKKGSRMLYLKECDCVGGFLVGDHCLYERWYLDSGTLEKDVYISIGEDCFLMQFTGLHDKNKKEDWVGDIVLIIFNGTVYYREIFQDVSGAFCVNVPSANSTEDASILLYSIEHENVGNVHENSELLNQNKQHE